jgi:hypothetical protein
MSKSSKGRGFRDYDRGKTIDRYSTYKGSTTPKRLIERTHKESGRKYEMKGSNTFGGGIYGRRKQ